MTIAAITGTYVLHEHTFSCQASALQLLRKLRMAAELGPAGRSAAVQRIRDRAVGAGRQQHLDRLPPARLSRQVEGGHALAMVGPAEAAAGVRIGAELEEPPHGLDPAVHRRPREGCPAVRIRVETSAELGES